jgi:hypothetical protein
MDLTISLRSIPDFLLPYTTSPKGCLQWIFVTMKITDSRSNYFAFAGDLVSMLSALQRKQLE